MFTQLPFDNNMDGRKQRAVLVLVLALWLCNRHYSLLVMVLSSDTKCSNTCAVALDAIVSDCVCVELLRRGSVT